MSSIALVSCIRNEEEMLPAFLDYHRAMGVDRAYIFLDRCTDRSSEIIARYPWVVAENRAQPEGPGQVALFQMACANEALMRARADGMDWLLMIDPDEFAWGSLQLPPAGKPWYVTGKRRAEQLVQQGAFQQLTSGARPETEMILLGTAELAVEQEKRYEHFWQHTNFQTSDSIRRPVLDPEDNKFRELDRWIGHRIGKSLVRTAADVQAFDSHTWTRQQNQAIPEAQSIPTERLGWLLHYVVTDAEHWARKYRRIAHEPDHWIRGEPVEFPRQAWKVAASRLTREEAMAYFHAWVAVPEQILQEACKKGHVQQLDFVREIVFAIQQGKLSYDR